MAEQGSPVLRRRGKGFPFIPLPEAEQAVVKPAQSGTEHTLEAFAAYLGHSTVNSGAFKRRLAALKDWGLVTGRGDTVTLTDLGRRLALPPEAAAVEQDRREAFAQSDVFMSLYDRSAKDIPLDEEHLANTAIHQLGIAPVSKDRFIQSFVESAIYVGLADRPAPGQVRLLPSGRPSASPTEAAPSERPSLEPASTPELEFPVVLRLPWEFQGGEVVLEIRLEEPPTKAAFDELGRVTGAIKGLVGTIER